MSSITIATNLLLTALANYEKEYTLNINKDLKKTTLSFSEENRDIIMFLNDLGYLGNSKKLHEFLFTKANLETLTAKSPTDFYSKVAFINFSEDPVVETKIGNKWYPVKASVRKFAMMGMTVVEFTYYGFVDTLQYSNRIYVTERLFSDSNDELQLRTFNQLFKDYDVRTTTPEKVERVKKLNNSLVDFNNKAGKMFDGFGNALFYHNWFGWDTINIGSESGPSKIIVEPHLENQHSNHHLYDDDHVQWRLPFVRVFSLAHKSYIYVDVECMRLHVYHREGRDKIVLPSVMMTALNSVFDASPESVFGDLFHGRHGGIVVLANGPSGVGKTLTAEVFAEYQERPLYSMEMSEIGTSVKEVEANLQRIFGRAKKWNAVLLFDEADIFLSEREASDLERSAIVGIFLRLLDYYEGTFFLTTNRGEGIDKAFKSRVTLYLNYPALTSETRKAIWQRMLEAAKINLVDTDAAAWDALCSHSLNGRQIRNQVRLLKLMHPSNSIKLSDITESLSFAAI